LLSTSGCCSNSTTIIIVEDKSEISGSGNVKAKIICLDNIKTSNKENVKGKSKGKVDGGYQNINEMNFSELDESTKNKISEIIGGSIEMKTEN